MLAGHIPATANTAFVAAFLIADRNTVLTLGHDTIAFLGEPGRWQGDGVYCVQLDSRAPGLYRVNHMGDRVTMTLDGGERGFHTASLSAFRDLKPRAVLGAARPLTPDLGQFLRERSWGDGS